MKRLSANDAYELSKNPLIQEVEWRLDGVHWLKSLRTEPWSAVEL